jgi:pyruvate dehydrogenase E2 component (dihydrolipoamide acetyltransferase)
MAEIITMPRLSDTMTEGKVSKWHKAVGDKVSEGDILAEIETDKAVQDFEAEIDGTLLYIGVAEGQPSLVDKILCIVGQAGEDVSALIGGETATPAAAVSTPEPVAAPVAAPAPSAPAAIPAGVEVIAMPRLSDTMTEGKVALWHKAVGDQVKEGDILAEIETDKAVQDFESEFDGVLLYAGVAVGEPALVDSVLAIVGPAGTDVSALLNGTPAAPAAATQNAAACETKTDCPAPAAPVAVAQPEGRVFISPLAKKLAQEKGIDISQIKPSADAPRISKKDIESFTPSAAAVAPKVAIAQPVMAQITAEDSETPNSQVRNIIAKRLAESKFSAPHYYLMIEVNMDKAIAIRGEINAVAPSKVSFNDMVIKATALALKQHPQINSSWAGDKIIHHGNINVGVAVAIEDGLVVPVLKNTDAMSYNQISASVKDLASRAKSKGLKANEMEGSTFSISNLGMFGIETFTSIINQPNSCILSVGAIVEKPIVKDKQIVVGNTMKLSLACDHRVVDGATGAQFLKTLKDYLESPISMMI